MAVDEDMTACGLKMSGQSTDQCAFPATTGPDNTNHFTPLCIEGYPFQGHIPGIIDMGELNNFQAVDQV